MKTLPLSAALAELAEILIAAYGPSMTTLSIQAVLNQLAIVGGKPGLGIDGGFKVWEKNYLKADEGECIDPAADEEMTHSLSA